MPLPPTAIIDLSWTSCLVMMGSCSALGIAATLGTLREALDRSLPSRVLEPVPAGKLRDELAGLLERVEPLSTSAALLQLTADAAFVGLLLKFTAGGSPLGSRHLWLVLALAAPALLFFSNALPLALARARGDALLVRWLPLWAKLQLPLQPVGIAVDALRRALQRVLGIADDADHQRRFVEGLRAVIEDSAPTKEIDDTARKLIENVLDFRDTDAAEVMTPRTEIVAAAVDEGLREALRISLQSGHSRIPIYGDSIDTIIGTLPAKKAMSVLRSMEAEDQERVMPLSEAAEQERQEAALRAALQPPFLVPETKKVPDLLKEFRARQQKVAVVLDEYGGTAGLVTLTAVVAEIVGEFPDAEVPPEDQIRSMDNGAYEVPAGLHVSEVNEFLSLEIPEESDFETLAGFVLASLGRVPAVDESFQHGGAEFRVLAATDRRVLRVCVFPKATDDRQRSA